MQKWKLLSRKDISPHRWFPLEMRSYELPSGQVVDDFSVTTLQDVSMIVPITRDKKIVLVRQYKPGVDDLVIEFPAGRMESTYRGDFAALAIHELEEETGIRVTRDRLQSFGVIAANTTKGTEKTHLYFVCDVQRNTAQKLDPNEEIEVLMVPPQELDQWIANGKVYAAQTIAAWTLAKYNFTELY
jgi:8-oxo-dGTP pyrophosphatase MutT (NUDIX family)